MTGFGAAEGAVGTLRVEVEMRSVNHRFLSPSIRLPHAFARWESDVRDVLRTRVARGHVTIGVHAERADAGPGRLRVDAARLADYATVFRDVARSFGTEPVVSFTDVLRLPGVLLDEGDRAVAEELGDETADRASFLTVVDAAAAQLDVARAAEGERIVTMLEAHLGVAQAAFARIAARAPARLTERHARLRESVRELTEGLGLSDDRAAQEIAILADRVDVDEEIDRFGAHVVAFRAAVGDGAEPVGKRLGFLLQEMLRETNTTGSKANDTEMLADVLLVKEELERLREQVENVE